MLTDTFMNGRVSMLLSIALLVVFAYLSSHFPQHLGTFFIAYFIVAMAATLFVGGRAASSLIRDFEYVKRGRVLLSVSREEVDKLRSRDKALNDELRRQSLLMFPQIVAFFVTFVILFVPHVRDFIIIYFKNLFMNFFFDDKIANFIAFLLFYSIFMLIFQISALYSKKGIEKIGGKLEVPLFYVVTENGLLLEERLPLKVPLNILDIKVDTRRRFVEFKVKSHLGGLSRYRLYFEEPRTLEGHLRRLTEQRG